MVLLLLLPLLRRCVGGQVGAAGGSASAGMVGVVTIGRGGYNWGGCALGHGEAVGS